MYIAPNTNIRILKNVPLDTSYDHTIWFDSASDQSTYFIGKQKYNLSNYTYQRVNSGIMKVGIEADNLYDCNYLMFQNTAFGNKWFYAFITEVNYVNNDVSEIKYEMDDIQSWFFDFQLDNCFVEREHTESDEMFEHFEPERVELGEYVYLNNQRLLPEDFVVIIQDAQITGGTQQNPITVDGGIFDGVYCGCTLTAFLPSDVSGINSFIQQKVRDGHPESIISIYMTPHPLNANGARIEINDGGTQISNNSVGKYKFIEGTVDNNLKLSDDAYLGSLGYTGGYNPRGYKPINKKLYTYPYNFPIVTNNAGSTLPLRYELSIAPNNGGKIDLIFSSTLTQPVQSMLVPVNYKEVEYKNESGYTTDFTKMGETYESLSIPNYPVCSWNYDAFKTWLAKETVPMIMNASSGVITGLLSGGLESGSVIHGVTNALQQGYRASIASDISKGNANCVNPLNNNLGLTYMVSRCTITAEYARRIDEYFSMYGYAVKRCKVPNRNVRDRWTYLKTIGCCVTGSVPADSMKHICKIHDTGITYWKNGDYVGQYRDGNGDMYENAPTTPTP